MKIIIFLDYEGVIPPFLQTSIEYARPLFDKIYVISNPINRSKSEIIESDKQLTFIEIPSKIRLWQYICALFAPFQIEFWQQIFACGINKAIIKSLLIDFAVFGGFRKVLVPIIKNNLNEGNEIYIVASWFSCIAVSAAKIKKQFPQIHAHSLAHAGEIDSNRNCYRNRAWAEFKHKWLDGVHFISKVKLDNYYKSLSHLKIKERFGNKVDISYLGSSNTSSKLNPSPERSKPFHIVTCSRTSPEKRLERLVETLKFWKNGSLEWTHIGTGPVDNQLRNLTDSLQNTNPLIKVNLAGFMPNEKIKEWYMNNPVDLFVNVSDTEGIPVSIMEAASFGIPCAATDVGGTSELITPEMGWLEPADFNPENFCKRINDFANLPPEQKNKMRTAARQIWSQNFNAAVTRPKFFKSILK